MGLGTAAASATVGELALGSTLVGGATAGINSLLGGASSSKGYEYARRLQKHDQAFQKEMRETAYQTMVGDMEKAGINPAVALSGGAGQAMGGGSSASAPNVNYGQVDLASILGTINQTALTEAQKQNIEADTDLKEKQSGKTKAETNLIKQQKEIDKAVADAEIALKNAQTKEQKANIAMTLTNVAKEQLYIAYINKYGHSPDAGWLDRAAGKLDKTIRKSVNEDTVIDSTKLTTMINEFIN